MPTTFTQWVDALKQYWRISLLAFVSILATAFLVIVLAPRVYQSQAKLMLRLGRESVSLDPIATIGGDPFAVHRTREHEIKSAIGVMQSREVLNDVVDQLGVDVILSGMPKGNKGKQQGKGVMGELIGTVKGAVSNIDPVPDHEVALIQLSQSINILAPNDSSVVSVSYQTESPEVAQKVVDAWVDAYIRQHTRVNRTLGTHQFFQEQSELLAAQLDAARISLQEAKNNFEIVTVTGKQQMLESQLTKVRDGLLEVETEIAATDSRVKEFDSLLKYAISPTVREETSGKSNEAQTQMRSQLFSLEVLEKDLRSKLTPEHPKLLAVQRQLAEATDILGSMESERKEVRESVNPAHQQISQYQLIDKASRQGLLDKRSTLIERKSELIGEMKQLNDQERQIASLETKVAILEERFTLQAGKEEQARLGEVLEEQGITSVTVVQPATLEQRPVSPNKPLCAVVGFLAASAMAFSLPILLQTRKHQKTMAARMDHNYPFESSPQPRGDRPVITEDSQSEIG